MKPSSANGAPASIPARLACACAQSTRIVLYACALAAPLARFGSPLCVPSSRPTDGVSAFHAAAPTLRNRCKRLGAAAKRLQRAGEREARVNVSRGLLGDPAEALKRSVVVTQIVLAHAESEHNVRPVDVGAFLRQRPQVEGSVPSFALHQFGRELSQQATGEARVGLITDNLDMLLGG